MDLKKTLQQTLWVSVEGLVLEHTYLLTEGCFYSWVREVCILVQRVVITALLCQGRSLEGKEEILQLVWNVFFKFIHFSVVLMLASLFITAEVENRQLILKFARELCSEHCC